jgi:hypothetical protein
MSDRGASFGAAFARDAGDPVASFIAAACDAWTVGLSALQLMADRASAAVTDTGQAAGGDPLAALIALTTGFTTAMSDLAAQGARQTGGLRSAVPNAAEQGDFAGSTDASSPMVRALMVGMASTLRYWRGLAGVYGRHQSTLMQATAGRMMARSPVSEADNRLLVDDLRGFLREIGDVAMQEARRLESELEKIGEALAHGTEQSDPLAPYRRRWRAKD